MSSQSAHEHGIVWNWLFGRKQPQPTGWERYPQQNEMRVSAPERNTDGIAPVQYPLHQPTQEFRIPSLSWCEQNNKPVIRRMAEPQQTTGPLVRRIEERPARRIAYSGRLVPLNEFTAGPVPVTPEPLEVPNRLPEWILPPTPVRPEPLEIQEGLPDWILPPAPVGPDLIEIQGKLPEGMLSLDNRDAINRALDAMFAESDEREQLALHIDEGRAALLGVTERDCQPLEDDDAPTVMTERAKQNRAFKQAITGLMGQESE